MTNEYSNDADTENPRPHSHCPRFADDEWHYVPDKLAQTISLRPAGDGEEGKTGCSSTRLSVATRTIARKSSSG